MMTPNPIPLILVPPTSTHRLGTLTLDPPGPVIAGSIGTWTLIYTVGSYGLDEGATLKLSQRFASDWQIPQLTRFPPTPATAPSPPTAQRNYVSITTPKPTDGRG
ncbi:MAG: hypothetical protein R2867_38935 [Caldilineaceae bacterium]